MNRQKKFIIVKDWSGENINIRIGNVFFYRDLLYGTDEKDNIDCYGGGRWDLDYENKIIELYGSSAYFGSPNKKDIEKAIKNIDEYGWWQIELIMEITFEDEFPDRDYSDIKNYNFKINY